ncbi:hypothetical protein [Streptomyces sp. NPDC006971]|uniref:hypothetical protein n=1 Tax=Streptomyces sp. NPDC006971 TaxID=3154784 RepID=UPI0033E5E175
MGQAVDDVRDTVGGAVVQQPPGQGRIAASRQQHGDAGVLPFPGGLEDELRGGVDQAPVRAVHDFQRGRGPQLVPAGAQVLGVGGIHHEVDRLGVHQAQAVRVAQGLQHGQVCDKYRTPTETSHS